jgi:hypothetical protein
VSPKLFPVLFLTGLVGGAAARSAGPDVTVVPPKPQPNTVQLQAPVGRQGTLTAGGEVARWTLVTPPGVHADLFPDSAGKTAQFSAPAAGSYLVAASTDQGTTTVLMVVGKDLPDPPRPPDRDPLLGGLRAAFEADRGRASDMQALAALYTLMVAEAGKDEYATAAALNEIYIRSRDDMLKGALPGVRKLCGAEIGALIGSDPLAPLTDPMRDKLKALYARLSALVLEAAK